MKESNIAREILIAASRAGHRLFINARGQGWVGGRSTVSGGVVTLVGASRVKFGVGPDGAADLIGWTRTGKFAAIEVKIPGERPRENQEAFLAAVANTGGVAGVATSADEALRILEGGG